MPNIAIIWDFDQTLAPEDSTTKTIECLGEYESGSEFWQYIKSLRGDKRKPDWEHVLASDAPIWMYALSRIAFKNQIPLNREFFKEFILPHIELYPNVLDLMRATKILSNQKRFRLVDLKVHHFVVSAGLKDLIEQVFPQGLVTCTFGCRYEVVVDKTTPGEPESIPVFCMDETMKTRSLFEISKGIFEKPGKEVNTRVTKENLWAPFSNFIYVGDGPTDVPALALTRDRGGIGIAVYNPKEKQEKIHSRLRQMRLDKRVDLIAEANFGANGELLAYIKGRCLQICQRYEAENSV